MTTTAGDRFGLARRLLTVVLCVLAVGGCTSMSGDLADMESRVTDLGFRDVVAWQRDENDRTIVTVEAYTTVPRAYERSDIEKIAEVVWDTYPHEFDVVELALNGYLVRCPRTLAGIGRDPGVRWQGGGGVNSGAIGDDDNAASGHLGAAGPGEGSWSPH